MTNEPQISDREALRYQVMRELEKNPQLSQRALASRLEHSLGAINYCLRALVETGLVKVSNFNAADNKLRYVYVLTPVGLVQKAALTRRFLARKLHDYDKLQREIAAIRAELEAPQSRDDAACAAMVKRKDADVAQQ